MSASSISPHWGSDMQGYLRFVFDQMSNPIVIWGFMLLEVLTFGLALLWGGWWWVSGIISVPFFALDVLKLVQVTRAKRQDFY